MDKKQRELATNRLLEVIRSGGHPETKPPGAKVHPPRAGEPSEIKPSVIKPMQTGPRPAPSKLLDLLDEGAVETATTPAVRPKPKVPPVPKPEIAPKPPELPDEIKPHAGKSALFGGLKKGKATAFKSAAGAKRIISIDIGTSAVKVIELARKDGALQLVGADSRPIPAAIRRNENSLRVLIVKILKELVPPPRAKGAEIHLTLPDGASLLKRLSMPSVAEKERANAIRFQLKKELPFPLEVCEITYRGWVAKGKERQDIEVLAVDRRALESRVAAVTEAGLIPTHITTPSAASRFLSRLYPGITSGKGAVVIVDIGATTSTITIVDDDRLVLSRTIATGGDDFTSVLQGFDVGGAIGELNEVQAEKYKYEHGLPPEGDAVGMRIGILMRPALERITAEISRSADFYRRERPDAEIQKVILVGGGSRLKRLNEFLEQNLGLEIAVATTEGWLAADGTVAGPEYMPALTAALDDGRELNLTPKSLLEAAKVIKLRKIIPPALAVVLLILITAHALALRALNQAETRTDSLKEKLMTIAKHRAQFIAAKAEFDKLQAELNDRENDFNTLKVGNPDIPVYLKAISNLVPPSIYLERLHTRFIPEKEQIKIRGEKSVKGSKGAESDTASTPKIDMDKLLGSLADEEGGAQDVMIEKKRLVFGKVIELVGNVYPQGSLTDVQLVDFVFTLENSGYFRDVAVDSVKTLPDGRVNFLILCGI